MRKILVFAVLVMLMPPGICAAANKLPAKEVIKKQQAAIKKKDVKIAELEKQLADNLMKPGPKREVEKPCLGWSSTLSFIGGGTTGWGFGSNNTGAKIAGGSLLLATLIAEKDSSWQCIAAGSIAGIGPGYWLGQKYAQDRAAKEALASSSTGTTSTDSAGGGSLPPPPSGAPSMMKSMTVTPSVMPFADGSSDHATGRPEWGGKVVFDFHF